MSVNLKDLEEFADFIQGVSREVGFRVSSRGWAYILEQKRFINKDEFDKVTNAINKCRKKGLLPIDFTAEEAARDFSGVERPSTSHIVDDFGEWLDAAGNAAEHYTPEWWEGEQYYIQMVVEKIDLVTLFAGLSKISYSNSKLKRMEFDAATCRVCTSIRRS